MSISLSVLCGSVCGKLIYSIYDERMDADINGEKIYLIQAGAYSSYDNMVKNTTFNNYVYYEDEDGLFKSIIGITENYNNIEKISKVYSGDVVVSEYYSNDADLNKKIKEFDQKIDNSSNQKEIKKNVLEMLSLYKDNKSTLVAIVS